MNVHDFHNKFDYLSFVTARGYGKKSYNKTHADLDALNVRKERSILMGSYWRIWENRERVRHKVENIEKLLMIYPEMDIVWVGDAGEGDYQVGKEIKKKYPERIKKIYIREINKNRGLLQRSIDKIQGIPIYDHEKLKNDQEINLFKNYWELTSFHP